MGSWNSQLLFGVIKMMQKKKKNQGCLTPFFLKGNFHQKGIKDLKGKMSKRPQF